MVASVDYRIVWNGNETFVLKAFSIKIRWVVMIASNEYNLIIGSIHTFGVSFHHIIIIASLVKPESTIACYNN